MKQEVGHLPLGDVTLTEGAPSPTSDRAATCNTARETVRERSPEIIVSSRPGEMYLAWVKDPANTRLPPGMALIFRTLRALVRMTPGRARKAVLDGKFDPLFLRDWDKVKLVTTVVRQGVTPSHDSIDACVAKLLNDLVASYNKEDEERRERNEIDDANRRRARESQRRRAAGAAGRHVDQGACAQTR